MAESASGYDEKRGGVEVALISINDLVPHEDVEEERLANVLMDIVTEGTIKKPIIVEKKRHIVIDGHHRLAALKALGLRVIPVFLAEYGVDVTDVGGWMYVDDNNSAGFKHLERFIDEVLGSARRGDGKVVVKLGDRVFTLGVDKIDAYLAIRDLNAYEFLKTLRKIPLNINYCLSSHICIAMPRLEIDDVYKAASKGFVLPPRTTCHKTYLKNVFREYRLKHLLKVYI